MLLWQTRAIRQSGCFVAEPRMAVGAQQQAEAAGPSLGIEKLRPIEIRDRIRVFAQMAKHATPLVERYAVGLELYCLVRVLQRQPRLIEPHPNLLPLEVAIGVAGVLPDVLLGQPEVLPWIGAQQTDLSREIAGSDSHPARPFFLGTGAVAAAIFGHHSHDTLGQVLAEIAVISSPQEASPLQMGAEFTALCIACLLSPSVVIRP